jgi:hypothetical protein
MTAARQQRKRFYVRHIVPAGFLLAACAVAVTAWPVSATERIVVDWHTGLAIDGYDPVAFYTDGKAAPGSTDFELSYGGAVWRFRNIGNRAAFVARPDVYMPQFGGYDPVGVARGVAVAGSPALWLISGERLFLFYDRERLETFIANPERITAAAGRKWPDVQRTLSP